MIYWISAFIFKLFSKIYFRGKSYGVENYPPKGPFIGVFNHNSNIDAVVVAMAIKHRGHTMAKDSLFRVPILSWWLKAVGMFPVVRNASDKEAFDRAVNVLKNGEIMFIAPEGTRKKSDDQPRRVRTGFVRMAQIANCPVVPVAVYGTDKVLPPGSFFPKPVKVAIQVGKPLFLEKVEVMKENKELLQQQADHVMTIIYNMVDELEQKIKKKSIASLN